MTHHTHTYFSSNENESQHYTQTTTSSPTGVPSAFISASLHQRVFDGSQSLAVIMQLWSCLPLQSPLQPLLRLLCSFYCLCFYVSWNLKVPFPSFVLFYNFQTWDFLGWRGGNNKEFKFVAFSLPKEPAFCYYWFNDLRVDGQINAWDSCNKQEPREDFCFSFKVVSTR